MEALVPVILAILAYVVLKRPIARAVSTIDMAVGYAEGRAKVLEPLAEKQNKLDLHNIDVELAKFKKSAELEL